jgi:peptide chain release factor 1
VIAGELNSVLEPIRQEHQADLLSSLSDE